MTRRVVWLIVALGVGAAQPPPAPPPPAPPPAAPAPPPASPAPPPPAEALGAPVARESVTPRPEPRTLDAYRADPDFQYDDPQAAGPSLWDLFWDWVARTFLMPLAETTSVRGWVWFWTAVAVLLIGWVVVRLLQVEGGGGVWTRRDADGPGVGLLDVDDIADIDLGTRLREALAAGDLREAVRIRYLSLLQALDSAGALAWRRDKTNRQYAAEIALSRPATAEAFRTATRVFEAVWYGERDVSGALYGRLGPIFDRAAPTSAPPAGTPRASAEGVA